jgi:hypothetical protein
MAWAALLTGHRLAARRHRPPSLPAPPPRGPQAQPHRGARHIAHHIPWVRMAPRHKGLVELVRKGIKCCHQESDEQRPAPGAVSLQGRGQEHGQYAELQGVGRAADQPVRPAGLGMRQVGLRRQKKMSAIQPRTAAQRARGKHGRSGGARPASRGQAGLPAPAAL